MPEPASWWDSQSPGESGSGTEVVPEEALTEPATDAASPPAEEFPLQCASLEWDPRVLEEDGAPVEERFDEPAADGEIWEVSDVADEEDRQVDESPTANIVDSDPGESAIPDDRSRADSQTIQETPPAPPGGPPTVPGSVLESAGKTRPLPTQSDSLAWPAASMTPVFDGSRPSATAPTSEELQSLNREWGDLPGTAVGVTVKSLTGDSGTIPERPSISDTVEMLPRRRLKSSEQPVDHPEYELLEILGEGGMGIVWNARQTSIDRSVALKMIKGPYARKPQQRKKFLAEAVVTGDLDHPNIVPIYDVGLDSRGKLFYAMKRVHGTPWLHVLRDKSLHENLQILLRVADAVAFAHARGIVHRDIKPENVMLGDFGEVLLMDWGLALPTPEYRKAHTLEFATGMGGTPAYMAPEMARGPIENITHASDIYLLGATLYDIVTGTAPHSAPSVRDCLIAAMRNRIAPTEQQGELVEIARKAMATGPEDRYASAQEFQAAIREYLAHEESISLGTRARHDLTRADSTDDYQDYARAVFGFEEAYELWNGNHEARTGLSQARLAYARSARKKGDFDLGLSLLDSSLPEHHSLHQRLVLERQEQQSRKQRLKVARRTTALMAAVIFVGAIAAGIHFRRAAVYQESLVNARDRAITEKEGIIGQRDAAIEENLRTIGQRDTAIEENLKTIGQRDAAIEENLRTIGQRDQALGRERQARLQEQYKAYVAGIGAAAARIDEGAFDVARSILDGLGPDNSQVAVVAEGDGSGEQPVVDFRNWEWRRLEYLCRLYSEKYPLDAPIEALAVSPDGGKLAVGSRDSRARVIDLVSKQVVATLEHHGLYVHSVAWSPDGRVLATGSSDPGGFIQLWRLDGEEPYSSRALTGHTQPVSHVEFSPDGNWLLSCSFDETARLWDLRDADSPRTAFEFRGHDWWVWDGAFAPGFNPEDPAADNRIVTVDQDGRAIVWQLKEPTGDVGGDNVIGMQFVQDRIFLGHEGPIYAVDMAENADGVWVATGGHDNRVLLWHPEDADPYSAETIFQPPQDEPKYRELRGHTNSVQSVRFSEDGSRLVTGGRDNFVWVWGLDAGGPKFRLRGHSNEVHDAVFTPDGRIVSGGLDKEILVWQSDRERENQVLARRRLSGHQDAILAARFSRDDREIVTASRDRTARIWNTRTGSFIAELREGHEYLVSNAVLFPDGLTLATAAADNTVRVWDIRRGAQRFQLPETGRNGVLAISRDGIRLVTGGAENLVQVWDMRMLAQEHGSAPQPLRNEIEGHQGTVTAAACSPAADVAATGDINGRTVLWNIDTGELIWSARRHNRRINSLRFTASGTELLIASSDGTLERASVETGDELERLGVRGSVSAFDLRGDTLVVAGADTDAENKSTATITIRDRAESSTLEALPFVVHSILITPDGTRALLACGDSAVRILRLDGSARGIAATPLLQFDENSEPLAAAALSGDGTRLVTMNGSDARMFELDDAHTQASLSMEFRPQDALADAQFSPRLKLDDAGETVFEGELVATASWDGTVRVWDAATWTSLGTFRAHESFVNSVVFSPDGSRILTAGDDGTARIWKTVEILKPHPEHAVTATIVLRGHTAAVNRAIFSPSGDQVLTVSSDGSGRLWNARTGEQVGTSFVGHLGAVLCAAFSADGSRIITGGDDNQARVWDVASREILAVLAGHTAAVTSVAFSGDASRAFTGSRDSTTKVWDVSEIGLSLAAAAGDRAEETGPRHAFDLLTLVGHGREVTSVTVSSDDRMILTGSRDGTAIVWGTIEKQTPAPGIPAAATASR